MAWIQSNEELATHPKTKRAARALGISLPTIAGHLHFLWWWCLKYAQDGDLSQFDMCDIADAAGWEGDPEQFITALIECGPGDSFGFLEQSDEGKLSVHDWLDYAGRLVEKREANAERMRDSRAKKARAKNVQNTFVARAGARVEESREEDQTESIDIVIVDNAREEILAGLSEMDDSVSTSANLVTNSTESVNEPAETLNTPKVNAIEFAEQNFGRCLKQFECERMSDWIKLFTERGSTDPDAILIAGLQRCIKQGAFKLSYLEGIMIDWLNNGVTTLDHISSRDEEWNANKERKRAGKVQKGGGLQPKTSSNKYDKFYL